MIMSMWWNEQYELYPCRVELKNGLYPSSWRPVWCNHQGGGRVKLSHLDDSGCRPACRQYTVLTDPSTRQCWQHQLCTSEIAAGPVRIPEVCQTGQWTMLTARRGNKHAVDTGPDTTKTTTRQCHSDQMMFAYVAAAWCGPRCQITWLSLAEIEWQCHQCQVLAECQTTDQRWQSQWTWRLSMQTDGLAVACWLTGSQAYAEWPASPATSTQRSTSRSNGSSWYQQYPGQASWEMARCTLTRMQPGWQIQYPLSSNIPYHLYHFCY